MGAALYSILFGMWKLDRFFSLNIIGFVEANRQVAYHY